MKIFFNRNNQKTMTVEQIKRDLKKMANPKKVKILSSFFLFYMTLFLLVYLKNKSLLLLRLYLGLDELMQNELYYRLMILLLHNLRFLMLVLLFVKLLINLFLIRFFHLLFILTKRDSYINVFEF